MLALCSAARRAEPDAALAVSRWEALQRASEQGVGGRQRRFLVRSYERAREGALAGLLMRALRPTGGSLVTARGVERSAPRRARHRRGVPISVDGR